jgi:hypothetical protein
MFQTYDHHQAENILTARVTQLTTDPLFYNIANIVLYSSILLHSFNTEYLFFCPSMYHIHFLNSIKTCFGLTLLEESIP